MRLGVFLPSCRDGFLISTSSPQYDPSWEMNLAVTRKCEELGFDFVLSMIKFRGFGGESGFWDKTLDSFSLMAGLAAATERINLIGSIPILVVNPALAARQAVTINQIAGGRFGVNIVTGWFRPEYDQYGVWPGDEHFQRRYDYATEYVQILRELWRTGSCTFDGDFFQMRDAQCLPTPPEEITIVCAGQSDRGLRFTAEIGDFNFISADLDRMAVMRDKLAAESTRVGRSPGTLGLFLVVPAATDAAAEERYQQIADGADRVAIATMTGVMEDDTDTGQKALIDGPIETAMRLGAPRIVGSYETVTRRLQEIDEAGLVDGTMLVFPDYIADLELFGEHVVPHLDLTSSPGHLQRA